MKSLKEILNEQTQNFKPAKFSQYQVFNQIDGKKKPLGIAWLMEGHKTFTIKLFSFMNEKYFLRLEQTQSPHQTPHPQRLPQT